MGRGSVAGASISAAPTRFVCPAACVQVPSSLVKSSHVPLTVLHCGWQRSLGCERGRSVIATTVSRCSTPRSTETSKRSLVFVRWSGEDVHSELAPVSPHSPPLFYASGVRFRDARGWTAMHYAVLFGKTKAVEALLKCGANPSPDSICGISPYDPRPCLGFVLENGCRRSE